MKQPTFDTIKSSLFSVDRSFFKLLNDDPWIFDGSWLSGIYAILVDALNQAS
jgi:hypothetical protein